MATGDERERDARGAEPERELEAALAGMPAPAPRSAFRDEVRAAFVRSSSRELAAQRTGSAVDERIEERIRRAEAEAPAARSAFREALRRDFVAAPAESRTPDLGGTPEPEPVSPLRKVLVITLAAAAAILVTLFVPSDPVWSLREAPGVGPVEVAGVSFGKVRLSDSDRARIGVELARGGTVVTGERELSLDLQSTLRLNVQTGTTVEIEALPQLDTAEPIVLRLTRGEVLIETLPGYPGNPIVVQTDDALVSVTGTVLGVRVDDRGTCTCVARGAVFVDDRSGATAPARVTAGTSYLLFHGGAMPPMLVDFGSNASETHREHTDVLSAFATGGPSGT